MDRILYHISEIKKFDNDTSGDITQYTRKIFISIEY